jgi:hypothetical protein
MSIYEAIVGLIGEVPEDMQSVAWVVSAVILLYLITCAFGIIGSVIKWITKGR